MSSTTRVGFVVPDVTDLADQITYYDNNVTVYETELPSQMVTTLPTTNYNGQVRTQNVAQNTSNPSPQKPYFTRLYNGGWVNIGGAGTRANSQLDTPNVTNNYVNASGTEVFDPSPLPGFTSVQSYAGGILKFCFTAHLDLHFSGNAVVNGKLNIFLNPNSSSQPNPSTPGVIRLSSPCILESQNSELVIGDSLNYCTDHFYGEMLYACTSTMVMGAAAYFSATATGNSSGVAINRPENYTYAANVINLDSLQIAVETLGTFSG